ncbi:conserved hypothetical protein [Paraburkholderia phymatum STM815]|uniref:Uncharacterized protein n=1 Tax=Paraburkholderia phymatum (strain DSM 17167 / CIP 108236 / LMG 21445 / STM815) TaxID=391038 RepID=B2JD56_PARP8|nr:conserved hypothetical protein [Paraburkholderia phymatum STM815]
MKGFRTGGRVAGTPNRTTTEIRALAGQYGGEAVARLVDLMRHAENEATRLAAVRELLDRGFGKAVRHAEVSAEVNTTPRSVREMSDEELLAILQEGRAEGARTHSRGQ